MKIHKHGDTYNKEDSEPKEKFKCEKCGCEFTAKTDEYYVDFGAGDASGITSLSTTITFSTVVKDYIVCSCPECHKIVKKIRTRKIGDPSSPSITYCTSTTPATPTAPVLGDKADSGWPYEDSLTEALLIK